MLKPKLIPLKPKLIPAVAATLALTGAAYAQSAYLNGKQIICLNIPDEFTFMDPRLIALLQAKVPQFLDHHD